MFQGDHPAGMVLARVARVCLHVLIIFVALWVLSIIAERLKVVLVPLAIALLLAALLAPLVNLLARKGMPRSLATAVSVLLGMAVLASLVFFVGYALSTGLAGLESKLGQSLDELHRWLVAGPLHLNDAQLSSVVQETRNWLAQHRAQLVTGLLSAFNTLAATLAGLLLAFFSLIFLLYDGPRIWGFLLTPFRGPTRDVVGDAGDKVFRVLISYVRVTALVAFIDAVGIGVGLVATRVPLALPLAVIVFLFAFIPILGAFVSGLLAVVVALVSNGFVTALVVLAIVVAVQQLEGHVLQPFLTGGLVRLHPLAVVLSVAAGAVLAGVVGALLAVPVVICMRAVVQTIADARAAPAPTPAEPEETPTPE